MGSGTREFGKVSIPPLSPCGRLNVGRIDAAAAERARSGRDEARAAPNSNGFNSGVHWCARNTRQSPGVLILLAAQAVQRGAGELFNPWSMYAVSHWAGELRRLAQAYVPSPQRDAELAALRLSR